MVRSNDTSSCWTTSASTHFGLRATRDKSKIKTMSKRMNGYVNALAVLAESLLLNCPTRGEAIADNATEGEISEMAEQRYLLYSDGKPKCRLVLPSDPTQEEQDAAELIVDVFAQMGGGKTALVSGPAASLPPFSGVDVHVGNTNFARNLSLLPTGMDDDGFVIHPAAPNQPVLLGPESGGHVLCRHRIPGALCPGGLGMAWRIRNGYPQGLAVRGNGPQTAIGARLPVA